MHTTADLRRAAIDRTFFPPTGLASAIARLGFVQADPIRAPARAQDLILRHRVVAYRAGDLEAAYPSLPVFEDMLHVYGFVHRMHRGLLYPRRIARRWHVEDEHPRLRRAILEHLEAEGPSHPRAIDLALRERAVIHPARASIVNAWGGTSNATTRMLEALHYRGLLHVTRRERGIRIYDVAARGLGDAPVDVSGDEQVRVLRLSTLPPRRRAEGLIHLLVSLYAPLPKASLIQLLGMLGDRAMPRADLHERVASLLRRRALHSGAIDGVTYMWPAREDGDVRREERERTRAEPVVRERAVHEPVGPETLVRESVVPEPVVAEPVVRFLAPFDPLVWDRRRFRQLWGWDYRFEAYTPAARRRFGYYAMPMLWDAEGDAQVIGWVNVLPLVSARESTRKSADRPRGGSSRSRIAVEPGYVAKRPRSASFTRAFDAEVERLERFLTAAE